MKGHEDVGRSGGNRLDHRHFLELFDGCLFFGDFCSFLARGLVCGRRFDGGGGFDFDGSFLDFVDGSFDDFLGGFLRCHGFFSGGGFRCTYFIGGGLFSARGKSEWNDDGWDPEFAFHDGVLVG